MVGLNIHTGYDNPGNSYADVTRTINELQWLGGAGKVRVRDGLSNIGYKIDRLKQVGQALGPKSLCLIVNDEWIGNVAGAKQALIDHGLMSYVWAVEGLNESNTRLPQYWITSNDHQTALWNTFHTDCQVVGPSYTTWDGYSDYNARSNGASTAHALSGHPYHNGWPDLAHMTNCFAGYRNNRPWWDTSRTPAVLNKPMVCTEFGFGTAHRDYQCLTEDDQAAQVFDQIGFMHQLGCDDYFVYELDDQWRDPYRREVTLGAFRADGSPKPLAHMLRGLAS